MSDHRICCAYCKYFWHEGASSDQPYPSLLCTKGKWDGVQNESEIYEIIECELFDRNM